jgi:ribosomal protein S8
VFLNKIFMLNYVNTLNLVRLGLHHKNQIIKIKQNKNNKKLLFILLQLNVILGWSSGLNQNKKLIYIVYCNNNINKQLFTLIKPTKQLFLKLKSLKKLSKKFFFNNVFLSTSKGLISINDAIASKVGGVLFFRIR